MIRYCRDCRYFEEKEDDDMPKFTEKICKHPDFIDIVTGKHDTDDCYDARIRNQEGRDAFVCGVEGRYWTSKKSE